SPTAQRLYRFLDKRFYNSPTLSLDLVELACGHVGLAEVDNVAILKRRLAPALAELERIGFLAPLPAGGGLGKVKGGGWGGFVLPLGQDCGRADLSIPPPRRSSPASASRRRK